MASTARPAAPGGPPGRFVVLEGIDGAGTTTQARRLAEALAQRGIAAHVTREPSDGPIGRLVRSSLGSGGPALPPGARALLFAADRLAHVAAEIRPALEAGRWVVCDRYLLSSLAYQGLDCDEGWVRAINRHAPPPDRTILLDVPAEVAVARIRAREGAGDGPAAQHYEVQGTLADLARRYRRLAEDEGVAVVDGTPSPAEVTAAILGVLDGLLPT